MQSVRPRGQLLRMFAISIGVMFTLGTAAANIIPMGHRASAAEVRAEEQAEVVVQRRARITELRAHADDCRPATSHELAKLLVMDGQFDEARAFAGVYELRCGTDAVVRHWGEAPRPRRR